MSVAFGTYEPRRLGPLVRFWNRSFADRRNFFAVTEAEFRARVVQKATAVERFDPAGMILAAEGDRVVGMVHVGRRAEAVCRALDPKWPGGEVGYVAFLHVEPAYRRRGVGGGLWVRGLAALAGTAKVEIDARCLNPFYGNSEGPFTPFWGMPEGIGIAWEDEPAKRFLAQRGFAPRGKAVQLSVDPSARAAAPSPAPAGIEIQVWPDRYPEVGRPRGEVRFGAEYVYECVVALEGETVAGSICTFPLARVAPDRYAIYEAQVAQAYRGRGLGRALLSAALGRLRQQGAKSCDVVTVPEVSPGALELYRRAGFEEVARWVVF